jgi:hypothetical protein
MRRRVWQFQLDDLQLVVLQLEFAELLISSFEFDRLLQLDLSPKSEKKEYYSIIQADYISPITHCRVDR